MINYRFSCRCEIAVQLLLLKTFSSHFLSKGESRRQGGESKVSPCPWEEGRLTDLGVSKCETLNYRRLNTLSDEPGAMMYTAIGIKSRFHFPGGMKAAAYGHLLAFCLSNADSVEKQGTYSRDC